MKARLYWIDKIRGGAIILVVLGHVTIIGIQPIWGTYLDKAIYAFHMPLFFAISGFVYGYMEFERPAGKIIRNKIISYGIPYLVFDLFYVVLNLLLQNVLPINTVVQLSSGLNVLFYPTAHYWYLHGLLIYYIVFSLSKNNRMILYGLMFASLVIYVLAPIIKNYDTIRSNTLYKEIGFYFPFSIAALCGRYYTLYREKILLEIKSRKCLLFLVIIPSCLFVLLLNVNAEKVTDNTTVIQEIGDSSRGFLLYILGSCAFSGLILYISKIRLFWSVNLGIF